MPAKEKKFTYSKEKKKALQAYIHIKGANANNLNCVEVKIPKNKMTVVTGVSGSGKSSLIMDTLFAEGQRRYVESLSSYARQFLMRMKKPEVEFIDGISPAIAIEQKVTTGNSRSTVGSMTEISDYLRILFARIGKTISPISGELVKKHSVSDLLNHLFGHHQNEKLQLFSPFNKSYLDRTLKKELELLLQKGYTRFKIEDTLWDVQDYLDSKSENLIKTLIDLPIDQIFILIDRFIIKSDDKENKKRIADSIQTAFFESGGDAIVELENGEKIHFNNRFELDGMQFIEPTIQLFNYNNPFGACPSCEGFGQTIGIDENKVIPNKSLSIFEDGVACWSGDKSQAWKNQFIQRSEINNFPIHRPYKDLSKKEKDILWKGDGTFTGIFGFFEKVKEKMYKIQNRVLLARYRGKTKCHDCEGGRLRSEANYVFIGGKNFVALSKMPIDELATFFEEIKLDKTDTKIGERLILEITNRLQFLKEVGLEYLSINRISNTLSGGETQRIQLTRMLGSNLTSSMYILDEPSVGLHPRDTNRLVKVLHNLRDLGNTVIVVEHEEDIIRNADFLIDVGPNAGRFGGDITFADEYKNLKKYTKTSLTAQYLMGVDQIDTPKSRRNFSNSIQVIGATFNNLKKIDVTFPLNTLTVVSGVSGSGKSTLVKDILYPALRTELNVPLPRKTGDFERLAGDISRIGQVELVSQRPIGKSSRSNPVTYVKAYDSIRALFSNLQLSKIRGYKPKHFSFNVEGGRCETCKGDGEQLIEMQFLADVKLTCESCNGKRFRQPVLEVKYKNKNIYDVLNMSIDEALEFFADMKEVYERILPLQDVGLGYVKMGQSSSTLSGGEAQRVKLAYFLSKNNRAKNIFFIFDEPTTGLHFNDIKKLLKALNALVEQGHTVVVVEHNLEVIKSADWIIDLGPEGGKNGGYLVYEGKPKGILKVKKSYTGKYLKGKI